MRHTQESCAINSGLGLAGDKAGAQINREERHVNLDREIDNLHLLKNQLFDLKDRIMGIEQSKTDMNNQKIDLNPSLKDVLMHGDSRICEIRNDCQDIIHEITSLLF